LDALGHHVLLELYGCDAFVLNDTKKIKDILTEAALLANARIVETAFHRFSPHGVSGVVIIAESHLSVHTWPEYEYAAIDIFTCGEDIRADLACNHIISKFRAKSSALVEMKRGVIPTANEYAGAVTQREEVLACKR